MDQKNRTILVIAIAVTVVAAVFVSIVLPAITGRAPQVTLPNVNQETEGESQAFLPVEVTPETVQTVIASLSRPDSYYRELTVTLFWEGGDSAEQVEIWADGGYVRTTIATGGTVVIDHGCGVKSYLYGLETVGVVRGQSVSTGDPLGTAGTSHSLIYELRIGSKSTDPQLALNGSSGLQFREAE